MQLEPGLEGLHGDGHVGLKLRGHYQSLNFSDRTGRAVGLVGVTRTSSSGIERVSERTECLGWSPTGTEGVVLGRLAGRGAAIGIGSSLPVAGVPGGCGARDMD